MSGGRQGTPPIGAILLDIEGTTTPVAFVTQVLFPYVRAHLRSHLRERADSSDWQSMVEALGHSALSLESVAAHIESLMDRDQKSTALKELQGRIWEDGYRRGELVGEVFADVCPALQHWRDCQVPVGIFSSGSVRAQQLLFGHSTAGDLTPLLTWHFDTRVGAKIDPESYRWIATFTGVPAEGVLFLSDTVQELDAASTNGMQVRLVTRPGNTPAPAGHPYQTIRTLEEIKAR